MAAIVVPDAVRADDFEVIVSLSGGKDSTAAALALREAGVRARYVFADTGWEARETYEHLDVLREKLGAVEVVGAPGGMRAKAMARAGFPSRLQRWCTRELKLAPLRAHHDEVERETGRETVSVVGIRAQESERRARLAAWDDDETWGGWVWRPILDWTIADVLDAHRRHGIPIHPLYRRGHNRVGCWPCIFAAKEEIALIAEHAPARVDEIAALEASATTERARRNDATPGRYAHPQATFFQTRDGGPSDIRSVVSWARTSHGGRQLPLLAPPPSGGCFRWGLCEPPAEDVAPC